MLVITITWRVVQVNLLFSLFPSSSFLRNLPIGMKCAENDVTGLGAPWSAVALDPGWPMIPWLWWDQKAAVANRTAWWASIWSDGGDWCGRKGILCLVLKYLQKSHCVLPTAGSLGNTCCITPRQQFSFFPAQGPLADLIDGPRVPFWW